MSDEAQAAAIYDRLAVPFAIEDHAKVSKGSGSQTYAPWTAYVERLNAELGKDWSFRAIREGFTESECWVLGEITAIIDGVETVRQQYGCEPVALGQKPNGDLLKKAATDAVKKAASLLGVGLYLSIKEEREAIEAAMREASRPQPRPAVKPAEPGKPAGPTPLHDAEKAAILTGANPAEHKPGGYFCVECQGLVLTNSSVTILKKKDGPTVQVPVADFAPVCEQRLGGFHCGGCYDKKYWKVA